MGKNHYIDHKPCMHVRPPVGVGKTSLVHLLTQKTILATPTSSTGCAVSVVVSFFSFTFVVGTLVA